MTVDIYSTTDNDGLSQVEYDLYELIMEYRDSLGLPSIPLSKSLTIVAGRHAMDTVFNIWKAGVTLPTGANLHSWSDAYYYSDHSVPENMWEAPQRLGTTYPSNGYEISAAGQTSIEAALDGWKGSTGHNNVITNQDIWKDITWNSIGIGVYQSEGGYDFGTTYGGMIYHVWFGRDADPDGAPDIPGTTSVGITTGETHNPGAEGLLLVDDPSDLYGDTVDGFDATNVMKFSGVTFGGNDVSFSGGMLSIDHNRDGTVDGTVTLSGDFSGGDFMAVILDGDTYVTFNPFFPTLTDQTTVDSEDRNGITNQRALTGDGSKNFKVTLQDMGFAEKNNALGVAEINSSGDIIDVRILFANVNADKSASATVTDVEAGNKLNFFLVDNGASWAESLASTDTLSFIDSVGNTANLSDGSTIFLAVNGSSASQGTFHSYDPLMNVDRMTHVLSGVKTDGVGLTIGFEDIGGGGDNDFEDVVFDVDFV